MKYCFLGHFSSELFQDFHLTKRRGGPAQRAPKGRARGCTSRKNCFLLIKNLYGKKKNQTPKNPQKWSKILEHFFNVFLTFFQISSRTWGINFDTIACVFEPVYGPKKKLFFRPKFDFLTFFQNDLGIKNFLANRPSLIRKKYSRRLKPSYLIFFSRFFGKFSKKSLK